MPTTPFRRGRRRRPTQNRYLLQKSYLSPGVWERSFRDRGSTFLGKKSPIEPQHVLSNYALIQLNHCYCRIILKYQITITSRCKKSTFPRIIHTSQQKSQIKNDQICSERKCYDHKSKECRMTFTIRKSNNTSFTEIQ